MGRFMLVCLVFLEDTLADLEGILGEIGEGRPTSGTRWLRRRRNRLRSLMRRHSTPTPSEPRLHAAYRHGSKHRRHSVETRRSPSGHSGCRFGR